MKNLRKSVYAVAVVLLAALVAGCGLVGVNEDRDRNTVVAEVNGEKILKGALLDEYRIYTAAYNVPEEQEKEVKQNILDQLVRQEVALQRAAQAGHVLNDQVRAEAAQEFEEYIQSYADDLRESAAEDAAAGEGVDYEQQARTAYDNWIASMGLTQGQYLERLAIDRVIRGYLDELTADLTVEESEIEELYSSELETQINSPTYIPYSPVRVVLEPEMRRVKHILVKLPQEDIDEIEALRLEQKNEEADALREERWETIRSNAADVLTRAQAGEDFEALIAEFGEDPGMEAEENQEGYTMLRDARMVPEFLQASFAMQEGQISDLVGTDFGFHIIKVYEARDNETAAIDDVREEIENVLLSQKKNEQSNQLMEEWLEAANIKTYERRF